MADPQAALLTQLGNIQKKTGKSLAELHAAVAASGTVKHGEKRSWLMQQFGLGHGDANTVIHVMSNPVAGLGPAPEGAAAAEAGDPLDAIYIGPKAALRPVHDAILHMVAGFGEFEIAPKKANVSLRRKKQFATVGPATRDLIEIGLNYKSFTATPRLKILPPGGMCQASVRLGSVGDVDAELEGWMRLAFDAAG
ncbi:MAG: DUF4287 domain-containing protein [Pseudomarimonas sp.]